MKDLETKFQIIKEIKTRICEAANKSQRDAGEISLIAVSKVQPNARVQAVLETGHTTFGENRVQEALGKWPNFQHIFGELDLHLIGPLQTNKARQAVELFGTIHSVDRPKLATTLAAGPFALKGIATKCTLASVPPS